MTAEKTLDKPLDLLSIPELVDELIELEAMAEDIGREIAEARAELKERIKQGEPYDHVVKVDGEGQLGMTVRVQRTRGAHRWKYNPRQVENRLRSLRYGDGFLKTTLDTKTFNNALAAEEAVYEDFSDIVRSEYDDDRLVVTGLKELIKHRGLEK